ncbi:hypothetical protein BKA63DRAFT_429406, partial [Paraphoma chrysanthemicola]
ERIQVSWILPSVSKSDHNRDEREAVTKYAQSLFNRPWGAIRPPEQPFRFPLVRTPIYKAKGRDVAANGLHRPGVFFQKLFNRIKLQTGGSGASATGPYNTYARDAFNRVFDATSDHDAVVASSSEANSILALHQDCRLEVAHLNMLRRAAPKEDAPGYFIELPALGSVTINGRTFSNMPTEGTTPSTALPPLIFGPLLRFTTIELLSQPVFFFRSRKDMNFTTPIASNKANRLGDEEVARRDGNDGTDPKKVTIRRTTTSLPSNDPGLPGGENSHTPQEIAYDDEWTTGTVTAHILDPGAWITNHLRRDLIVDRVRQILRSTSWLDNLFTDGRSPEDRLMTPVQWVPCAQTNQNLITHVNTVLNAWALVMRLSLNPRFALGDETTSRLFCHDAMRLIAELAGNDGLQWKKVLAFFRHWDLILETDV